MESGVGGGWVCRYPEGQKLWENDRIPDWSSPGCGDCYLWELRQGYVVGRNSVVIPSRSAQRDLSHWNKVKVLLNRIRWRSSKHSESPAPPDGPAPR